MTVSIAQSGPGPAHNLPVSSVVVHYAELALKGRNRPWFINTLVRSMREALADPAYFVRLEAIRGYARRYAARDGCGPIMDMLNDRSEHVVLFALDAGPAGREPWAIEAASGWPLLRSDQVGSLDPIAPPLATILPLDAGDQVGRLESGALEPDEAILGDRLRPLVFYQIAGTASLQLVKTSELRKLAADRLAAEADA